MARRWLVNTSNDRLVGVIDDDDAPVPAGRSGVAQSVIRATGVPRDDIKTGGTWVITNGVGVYTAPTPATTAEIRDRRRVTLARNIIKNWLPAANGLLGIADAAVNLRLGPPDRSDGALHCRERERRRSLRYVARSRSHWSTATTSCCTQVPQWDNTNGRVLSAPAAACLGPITPNGFMDVPHHQPESCGLVRLKATPAARTIRTSLLTTSQATTSFNWMREVWKLANP